MPRVGHMALFTKFQICNGICIDKFIGIRKLIFQKKVLGYRQLLANMFSCNVFFLKIITLPIVCLFLDC